MKTGITFSVDEPLNMIFSFLIIPQLKCIFLGFFSLGELLSFIYMHATA